MRLSFDWLSDFVDLSGISPQEVADRLTMGAFEVEEVRKFGADIKGEVVVGEIVEINPHPNADKIRLTKIKLDDKAEPREIVCGAWNIEVGNRIPVALPGAVVIDRKSGGALEIKESKIRGVTSLGMLCSPPELGLQGGGEGILILEQGTALGTDVKKLLGLVPDYVLHVEPRSNRGDALSVLGLAREVAALFDRPLKSPDWKLPDPNSDLSVPVNIESTDDCPFFTARVLTGLKMESSPAELSKRLEAIGVRSVSNIVDITNYVMHELGQPLHAYDISVLNGPCLEVRRGREGEKLITIDERERKLTDEVLVIADRQGPVGVAGVMGGKGSEISDNTRDVALEAAAFNSARVRRSSRLLGLSSDSSLRFERGVDPASVREASDRAAYLMLKYCHGKLGTIASAGNDQIKPVQVTLRMSEVARLTELEVDAASVTKLLEPLGFEVKGNGNGAVSVAVPSFRQKDVTREVDLVEEVCRLYGYDRVPVSMPKRTVAPPVMSETLNKIRHALTSAGLNEAWISSLIGLEDLNGKGVVAINESKAVKVLNPLSQDHQVLRQSLIPGLLKAVVYNQHHGRNSVWLFEIGRTYFLDKDAANSDQHTGCREIQNVAGVFFGDYELASWHQPNKEEDIDSLFYNAKGSIESLLHALSIPTNNVRFINDSNIPKWFHPKSSCRIELVRPGRESVVLGWLGQLHPKVGDAYELKKPGCIFELSVDALESAAEAGRFKEIHTTPAVVRDLSADLDTVVHHSSVEQCIIKAAGNLLRNVELVSVFRLSDTKKSLSYRMTFQHPQETLTAEQVEEKLTKVRSALTRELSATFRT